jgi:sugar lactone lactonase YvrE
VIAARQVTGPLFTLAEGPVWDPSRRRVLWVDIPEGLVLVGRLQDGQLDIEARHAFQSFVGATAVAGDGSVLVAETRTLTRVASDGTRTSTGPIGAVGPRDRFNDGLCDARGRFVVGTLSLTGDHHSQRLLQVGAEATVLDDGLGLSNGLAFSPDGATLYSVDSMPGTVWRRDYDHDTGRTGTRSLLIDLHDCTPDGLTVDIDGQLWLAVWGRGEVRCYSPEGALLDTIRVPAPHTSSVAFVGDDLDQLVITTARDELTDVQLREFPLSGSLFLAEPGVRGIAPHPWSGHLPH